ncbi:MAG: D-aminoacyl-tRNA deacylase [Cyanobacteria bacterium P01_H01_bin.15]
MRVVIQRVTRSQVSVAGKVVGQIGRGLNLLVGIHSNDSEAELDWMTRKCLALRLFPSEQRPWAQSVLEVRGEILVVSQFTLYGNGQKGRRPSFSAAAPPDFAQRLYEMFVQNLRASGLTVASGIFGADMQVSIENDGPVTLILER